MQRRLCRFALRTLLGLLILSMAALTAHGQTTITDAAKGAYDFDSLSGVIDADQVDYFSGNWSYAVPLGEVEGAGGLSLPLSHALQQRGDGHGPADQAGHGAADQYAQQGHGHAQQRHVGGPGVEPGVRGDPGDRRL